MITAYRARQALVMEGCIDFDVDAVVQAAVKGEMGEDALAMMRLGLCYQQGKGVLVADQVEATRCFQMAIEAPNPPVEAYYYLAQSYHYGRGVRKNLTEAARLYRIAAESGHASAQCDLGMCLQHGEGVHYNPVESFTWLKRAADAKHVTAQGLTGHALETGFGVREDEAAGVEYYRLGAHAGDVNSMNSLGLCYCYGRGVPRNPSAAVKWLTRARDSGNPAFALASAAELAQLTASLTMAQRATADQLLRMPPPSLSSPTNPPKKGKGKGAPLPTRAEVLTMGTGALKRLLQEQGVDVTGVHEKGKLVALVLAKVEEGEAKVEEGEVGEK